MKSSLKFLFTMSKSIVSPDIHNLVYVFICCYFPAVDLVMNYTAKHLSSSPSLLVVEHVRNEHDSCVDSIPTNYLYHFYFYMQIYILLPEKGYLSILILYSSILVKMEERLFFLCICNNLSNFRQAHLSCPFSL